MTLHTGARTAASLDGRSLPLADVLGQMSRELENLTIVAEDVQNLTAALTAPGSLTAGQTRRLQQLDLLTQTLGDLANATRHLAGHAPDGAVETDDLGLSIILADLRARLTGKGVEEKPEEDAGTVALF